MRPTTFAKYERDGLNRRVKKYVPGQEPDPDSYRHFYYNTGWQLLETRENDDEQTPPQDWQPEYQYVWSARYIDAPILRDKNTDEDGLCDDERLYYTTDANMNVTALFSTAGVALERYTYDAYGHTSVYDPDWESEEDTNYDNVILFAGYYRDPETWFYHVRNRFHHAELGRWHQRDPLRYVDGMSLYEYVGGNPLLSTDPTGEENACCKDLGIKIERAKVALNADFRGQYNLGANFVVNGPTAKTTKMLVTSQSSWVMTRP